MRILIVDDEPAARRRLSLMLDELDEEVVAEAANGVEAIALSRERAPDVLLLDIAMPEVDGFDVARHLHGPRPLVIFQTAYDDFAIRAFEHEALDYLLKPVTLERLRTSAASPPMRGGSSREPSGCRECSTTTLGRDEARRTRLTKLPGSTMVQLYIYTSGRGPWTSRSTHPRSWRSF